MSSSAGYLHLITQAVGYHFCWGSLKSKQTNKQKNYWALYHQLYSSDEGSRLLKAGIRCVEESPAPQEADTNKPRTLLAAATEKVWRHWKLTKQIGNLKPASEVTYAGFPVGARGKWSSANQALRAALSHGKQTGLGCQVLVDKSHSSLSTSWISSQAQDRQVAKALSWPKTSSWASPLPWCHQETCPGLDRTPQRGSAWWAHQEWFSFSGCQSQVVPVRGFLPSCKEVTHIPISGRAGSVKHSETLSISVINELCYPSVQTTFIIPCSQLQNYSLFGSLPQ